MLITNSKVYDTLKWIAMVALPAVGTLYFAIAQIWGLPDGNEVVGTIVAVDTGLGTLLHISSATYKNSDVKYDGHVNVTPEGKATLNLDPHAIVTKDKLVVKVTKT